MQKATSVDDYINQHLGYQQGLISLRKLLNETVLTETIKWGAPCYTLENKNILGIGAFKSYFGLWFYQGALIKDKYQLLINAQEGKTQAMRQMRFNNANELDENKIRYYLNSAIDNHRAGKFIPVKKSSQQLILPEELINLLKQDNNLELCFEALTPYKQKEFAEFISSAKREATKLSRLDKIKPLIKDGIGLHDKYRNC